MANSEKEPFQLRTLFTGYEKLGTVITDLFAGFISSPAVLAVASVVVFLWTRHDGYGMAAVLSFIFGLWMLGPVGGWVIRSSNQNREGIFEVTTACAGAVGMLMCLVIAFSDDQTAASYDPFNPPRLYKTIRVERIKPKSVTFTDNMIVLVCDTLVLRSTKIEDYTNKKPMMCVKHYINSFKVEYTTPPKVCGE